MLKSILLLVLSTSLFAQSKKDTIKFSTLSEKQKAFFVLALYGESLQHNDAMEKIEAGNGCYFDRNTRQTVTTQTEGTRAKMAILKHYKIIKRIK